jgi:plastocyanin
VGRELVRPPGIRRAPSASRAIAGAALAAALVVVGCGGGNDKTTNAKTTPPASTGTSTSSGGGGTTIAVHETEFKLSPANVTVAKPGPVTIRVTNDGKVEHSLEVEGPGIGEKKLSRNLSPGQSATLDLTLKKGKYEWYCPVDAHKSMGMKGSITVGSGSSGAASTGASGGQSGAGQSSGGGGGGGY